MSDKEIQDFKTSLWDPRMKGQRKQMFKALTMFLLLCSAAVWACLSVFWGSTYLLEHYFPNAKLYVYDFDSTANQNPLLGPTVVQYLRSTLNAPVHMGVIIRNPTGKTFDDVAQEIVGEKAWAAVVINANATSNFRQAIAGTGGLLNGQWAPEGAISLVVSGARWYQVTDDYLLPYLGQQMRAPTQEASRQATAQFLATATPATLSGITQTQQAALSTPFSYQETDLRPIHPNQWSGAAPQEAGLIYYVIFAFHISIFLYFSRMPFLGAMKKQGVRMTWLSTCALRFLPTFPAYVLLSLSYSLINKAFLIPVNGNGYAKFGPQGGFMIFWMLNLMTLFALGFAMESMITLLTLRFFPFFLISWIILNISSSFFPPTFAEKFYHYGYGMPFYHSITGARYIMYGTRDRLGLNFGVLTAWTVLSVITTCLFELMWRRIEERKQRKERAKDVEGQSS